MQRFISRLSVLELIGLHGFIEGQKVSVLPDAKGKATQAKIDFNQSLSNKQNLIIKEILSHE